MDVQDYTLICIVILFLNLLLLGVNLAVLGLAIKIYTEYVKDKLASSRKPTKVEG